MGIRFTVQMAGRCHRKNPTKSPNMLVQQRIFCYQVSERPCATRQKLMQPIGEDVDEAYYAEVATVTINHDLINKVGKNMSLVYSPLHGTGRIPAQMVLRNAGFENFRLVPEQSIADPEFATTPFPNPEFAQVFDLPIALGKKSALMS